MSSDQSAKEIKPGLLLVGDREARWTLRADNIEVLRGAIGENLLVGFCQCFALAERLLSVLDLIALNGKHVGTDSVRGERNLNALGALVSGYAHELRAALANLSTAGVADKLSEEGRQRWAALLPSVRPKQSAVTKKVRDAIAFHPGEPDVIRRGLKSLAEAGRPVDVLTGDGHLVIGTRSPLGLEVTLAGLAIEEADLSAALAEAQATNETLLAYLEELFLDVLRSGGAALSPLSPMKLPPG